MKSVHPIVRHQTKYDSRELGSFMDGNNISEL